MKNRNFISKIKRSKVTDYVALRVEINHFCDSLREALRNYFAIDEICGIELPTHFLKVGVVLLGIIFLKSYLIKPHILCDEMILMHCWL